MKEETRIIKTNENVFEDTSVLINNIETRIDSARKLLKDLALTEFMTLKSGVRDGVYYV